MKPELTFPLLRSPRDYERGEPVEDVRQCQHLMDWATHVVIFYPLWLGSMPALLKALLEQIMRPGFAFSDKQRGRWRVKFMSGKSARIVVTMGMPALVYRWYFRAHSLKSPATEHSEIRGLPPSPLDDHRQHRQPEQRAARRLVEERSQPGSGGGLARSRYGHPRMAAAGRIGKIARKRGHEVKAEGVS